ncbi:hypothetical protein Hanom_Chr14g01254891 [Helianthus anomalus]
MNFVKSTGTDKIITFENKPNVDFVNHVKILKRDDQNNSRPSTSKSQSSSSSHQNDSSGFVELISYFECGEFGQMIRNCPYLHKLKAKADVPP